MLVYSPPTGFLTSTHRCVHVDVVAASMTTVICRVKRVRQSNYIGDANGAIDTQAYSRTRTLTYQPVPPHTTAFSSHVLTASDPNSVKYPETLAPPGELHRGCYTTTTRSYTTTPSARSWCQRSASSLSTRSTGSAATSQRHYRRQLVACLLCDCTPARAFEPVTDSEVRRLLSAMPPKSSPLDVLPCCLLKACADVFTPIIIRLANLSFQTGNFPSSYKRAQVLPLLKKAGLDTSSPANYRPISNLSTVSKVLERLLLARLCPHLLGSINFSQFQSAYRKGHCTETELLEVLDSVYTAADDKKVTVLVGLDLSAAFDTVSHDTLLDRLQREFGVTATALSWIQFFLSNWSQFVKLGHHL